MEVAIIPSNLLLRASFNVSRFYAAVAILQKVFYPKKRLCASVTRRKVHSCYISFFAALSQHVILLMSRTEVISGQISLFPSQHNAPDLHPFSRKTEYKNQLEKKLRDQLTYYFRIYYNRDFYRMYNI